MKNTLNNLLEQYLSVHKGIESSTVSLTKRVFGHLVNLFGDCDVSEFNQSSAEKFQAWILNSGKSPVTANIWCKTCRPLFRWAKLDPFENVGLLKVPKKFIRVYTPDEFESLMRSAPTALWKARLIMARTTGMRRGEILNLCLSDIDFDKKIVKVQEKKETETTWEWKPKDKDERQLPLTERTTDYLIDVLVSLPKHQPYVMLSANRYRHLITLKEIGKLNDTLRKCPDANFNKRFSHIVKKSGIAQGKFHDLRSTAISEWLWSGISPHECLRLSGHSSIEVLCNSYAAIQTNLIDKARNISGAFVNPANNRGDRT